MVGQLQGNAVSSVRMVYPLHCSASGLTNFTKPAWRIQENSEERSIDRQKDESSEREARQIYRPGRVINVRPQSKELADKQAQAWRGNSSREAGTVQPGAGRGFAKTVCGLEAKEHWEEAGLRWGKGLELCF